MAPNQSRAGAREPGAEFSRRALERALVLATGAAVLSRGRSLVPRTPQDQTLITTGAGLMGAAAGALTEGATSALGRLVPGGRKGATALLTGLALGGLAWARRRGTAPAAAETSARVLLVSSLGGEIALEAYARLPGAQRSGLADRAWTTALAAASGFGALRQRLAEPRDLVKAGIHYDFLPTVSGGPGSLLPLANLDREGRKFLGCAVPASRIDEVMGGNGAVDPVRVYAGLGSAPTPAERARLAVEELARLGGLTRRRIMFFCPTGAGYVNPVAAEAEELLSRGDVASVVVQYSNQRANRAFKYLSLARETWHALLTELDSRLDAIPAESRPEVVVYGESLGAWVVAEALAERGVRTLDTFRIARGVLIGLPFAGGQTLRAVRDRGEPLPEGLGVFAELDELQALPAAERERLRYLIFTHAEDPIANFSGLRLLWERPPWLKREGRHRRLPAEMRWLPGITYLQLLFDLKNASSFTVEFDAYAHDYRPELPTLLRVALGHADASDEQLQAIEEETARSVVRQAEREARARVGRGARAV